MSFCIQTSTFPNRTFPLSFFSPTRRMQNEISSKKAKRNKSSWKEGNRVPLKEISFFEFQIVMELSFLRNSKSNPLSTDITALNVRLLESLIIPRISSFQLYIAFVIRNTIFSL